MAESEDKAAKNAEEAYAAAAAEAKSGASKPAEAAPPAPATPAAAESAPADPPVAAKPKADAPAPERKPAPAKSARKTPAAKKPVNKAKPAANVTRKKSSPQRAAARKAKPAAPELSITELKEKIMANAKTTDFTKPMSDAMGEVQARTKAALEKSTEIATEMTEFSKGNVEAFVESGRVLAGGMQDLGKTYADEARTAYEALTADMKEMASVKSPTELLQLQAKLARRNFETMFAYGSKNGEAMMKLVNEAFAPISSRMNVAAEKMSKAA